MGIGGIVELHGYYLRHIFKGIGEDKMCWKPNRIKGFLVSSYYHLLVDPSDNIFPWKGIWKQKVPSRVAFFVWTAALGESLAIDNVRKKRYGLWISVLCASVMVN